METKGHAYQLWARVDSRRIDQGWTTTEMAEYIGLPRNTIDRLRTNPRKPQAKTVHKIADALERLGEEITRREAETLAGLRPPEPTHAGYVSAVEAIRADQTYTEAQRAAMLELAELFGRANRQQRQSDSADDDPTQASA